MESTVQNRKRPKSRPREKLEEAHTCDFCPKEASRFLSGRKACSEHREQIEEREAIQVEDEETIF